MPFHLTLRLLSTAALGLLIATPNVHAQAFDAVRLQAAGTAGGSVGLVAIAGPEYPGANQRNSLLFPSVDYQWANGWFAGVGNGVGVNLSAQPQWQYGPRLTADLGRPDSAEGLHGMGSIDARAELGLFANYLPTPDWALTASLRAGSGQDSNGVLLDLGVGYSVPLAAQWRLGSSLGVTLANANALQSYFGVDANQAARSGYNAYTPGSGVRDVRLGLSLTYAVNPRTFVTAAVLATSLGPEARNSPLVRSPEASSALLALTYAF